MRKGFHGYVLPVLCLILLSVVCVAYVAYAEQNTVPPPPAPEVEAQKGEVVLDKAVALNTDIRVEIDAVLEAKRREEERKRLEAERLALQLKAEQEHFDDFIRSAKSHKFKGYDLTKPSGLKGYQLDTFLEGTGLEGLGDSYAKAEELHGVNAFVLMCISAHEASWGNSQLAKTKNNIFGYQAYDSNVGAAKTFKSKAESILHVAKRLSEDYLQSDGKYHKGTTLADVNHYYASDTEWSNSITSIMNRLVSNR